MDSNFIARPCDKTQSGDDHGMRVVFAGTSDDNLMRYIHTVNYAPRSGSYGFVWRYVRERGRVEGDQDSIALKTFKDVKELMREFRSVDAVNSYPALRDLCVPCAKLPFAIVMRWMQPLSRALMADLPRVTKSQLWMRLKLELDVLHRNGYAFFDLKRSNLVLENHRLILIDLGGVYFPGTMDNLQHNTYGFPAHSGHILVNDSNVEMISELCTRWSMLQIAWDMFGAETTLRSKHVLAYVTPNSLALDEIMTQIDKINKGIAIAYPDPCDFAKFMTNVDDVNAESTRLFLHDQISLMIAAKVSVTVITAQVQSYLLWGGVTEPAMRAAMQTKPRYFNVTDV
jgi:hypothetical protein